MPDASAALDLGLSLTQTRALSVASEEQSPRLNSALHCSVDLCPSHSFLRNRTGPHVSSDANLPGQTATTWRLFPDFFVLVLGHRFSKWNVPKLRISVLVVLMAGSFGAYVCGWFSLMLGRVLTASIYCNLVSFKLCLYWVYLIILSP